MADDEHTPRVRRAFVCYEKPGVIHLRKFLLPHEPASNAYCADHGRMKPQPNHPYHRSEASS